MSHSPVSHPRIYWCELPEAAGGLAVTQRPRAAPDLEADARHWAQGGIEIVVSLLEVRESDMLRLAGEAEACAGAGLRFVSFPVSDHSVPRSMEAFAEAAAMLSGEVREGRRVACHCFAGMGRSPMMAAGVLIGLGLSAEEACRRLSATRGLTVPETKEQRRWLDRYARLLTESGRSEGRR